MIFKNWHLWQSNNCYLLSDESIKKLRSFRSFNDAINWLFLSGEREAARYFNGVKK